MGESSNDRSRWRRVESVLDRAFDLSGTERASFLAVAFAADPEIRVQVERILAAVDSPGGLLDLPVGEVVSEIVGRAGDEFDPGDRSGDRLGSYELLERLGWGGMGEVYRARDAALGRVVAVKVLRSDLADDPALVARLRREAQLLASLEHPRIARLYAFGEFEGSRFLAMELVDGETLAARLVEGPLSMGESLRVCAQIAEGLDAAHLAGVVHRDLKPGNVILDRAGDARLVDFGVARSVALAETPDSTGGGRPHETRPGSLIGTAPYMSPEQARGQAVDARTDIWALGCTLYESLSGVRPFQRANAADTVAAILGEEPDWTRLPPEVPEYVRRLLERMLCKDPRERQRSAGDAWLELRDGPGASPRRARSVRAAVVRRTAVGVGGAALLALALGAAWWSTRPHAFDPTPVRRFAVSLPPGAAMADVEGRNLAISPDGDALVFAIGERLWLRPLASLESAPIPGTDHARSPLFSPDGAHLVFWQPDGSPETDAGGTIMRLRLDGDETPLALAPTDRRPWGMNWGEDDHIYFASAAGAGARRGAILRVSATGGVPERVIEGADQEFLQGPRLLPGGEWLLFSSAPRASGLLPVPLWEEGHVVAQSLRTGERRLLTAGGTDPSYVSSGHILYAQAYRLLAAPFDLDRIALTGAAQPVVQTLLQGGRGRSAQYSFSRRGHLVYVAGTPPPFESELVRVEPDGRVTPLPVDPARFGRLSLSADGRRLAVTIASEVREGYRRDIWIYELDRGGRIRLTSEGDNSNPVFSPDGRWVFYASDAGQSRERNEDIWRRPVDRSAPAERMMAMAGSQTPGGIDFVGDRLLVTSQSAGSASSTLWLLPLAEGSAPVPLELGPGFVGRAALSPDGTRLAYVATGSDGRGEVRVYEIATARSGPVWEGEVDRLRLRWSANGRRFYLFTSRSDYRDGCVTCPEARLVEVEFRDASGLSVSAPGPAVVGSLDELIEFEPAADGVGFLAVRRLVGSAPRPPRDRVTVVLGWFSELDLTSESPQ